MGSGDFPFAKASDGTATPQPSTPSPHDDEHDTLADYEEHMAALGDPDLEYERLEAPGGWAMTTIHRGRADSPSPEGAEPRPLGTVFIEAVRRAGMLLVDEETHRQITAIRSSNVRTILDAVEREAALPEPSLDVEYLRAKLLDQHSHSQQYIEDAFIEAGSSARLRGTGGAPTP